MCLQNTLFRITDNYLVEISEFPSSVYITSVKNFENQTLYQKDKSFNKAQCSELLKQQISVHGVKYKIDVADKIQN